MACYFVDWDGTFAKWGTEEPLPGALEQVTRWLAEGHQVVFTTQRDPDWANKATEALRSLGFKSSVVLADVSSPRVVINDAGAFAFNHVKDASWGDCNYGILS